MQQNIYHHANIAFICSNDFITIQMQIKLAYRLYITFIMSLCVFRTGVFKCISFVQQATRPQKSQSQTYDIFPSASSSSTSSSPPCLLHMHSTRRCLFSFDILNEIFICNIYYHLCVNLMGDKIYNKKGKTPINCMHCHCHAAVAAALETTIRHYTQ
jgi:hypothetical protein